MSSGPNFQPISADDEEIFSEEDIGESPLSPFHETILRLREYLEEEHVSPAAREKILECSVRLNAGYEKLKEQFARTK